MDKLIKTGRWFYAFAMAGVAFQQCFYSDFHPMILPPLHGWIPALPWVAWLTAILLVMASLAILTERKARLASLLLGGILLSICLFYYIPYHLMYDPYYKHLGVWGDAEKELALAGGAFSIAGTFPSGDDYSKNKAGLFSFLEKLIPLGPVFFSITMISFGIDHCLYTEQISTLVPLWLPGAIFWTYLAAFGLIASGIAIMFNVLRKPAGIVLGTVIFIWLIILHIPRALADPMTNMGNEVTSAFSALAFIGIAYVIAGKSKK